VLYGIVVDSGCGVTVGCPWDWKKSYIPLLVILNAADYVQTVLQTIPETVMQTKSCFTLVILPLSPLSQSADVVPAGTQLWASSPAVAQKYQIAVAQLTATLANQPYPDRVVRYSYVQYFFNNNNSNNNNTRKMDIVLSSMAQSHCQRSLGSLE